MRFSTLFIKKNLHLGPIWTGKNGFTQFFVFTKILAKNMLPLSGWHNISVVIDYADTRLAQSLTMRTMSQNNSWLREHVNYFALEKVKSEKKVTKNVTLYFRKIVLILCWRSHWLHRSDTCLNSCWLRGHNVSVVVSYVDGVGKVFDHTDKVSA